jgi:FkbM family methyltransferase
MSFVSYAQNREDVLLRRALSEVAQGFYVDVGAQDPDENSVTKAFYEAGWRGINIEPVNHWYEKLVSARPEDINICTMAGTSGQSAEFFEIEGTGLSTADKAQAEIHRNAGFSVTQTTVTTTRLDALLARHDVGVIHFLKVDVEGSEDDVLRSIDLRTWRPWIIVVEATVPLSQELADNTWQEYLEAASYEFVYFDGLNKYFVSEEKSDLKKAFSTPVNNFDEYITAGEKENFETKEAYKKLEFENSFSLLDNKRLTTRLAARRVELETARSELEAQQIKFETVLEEKRREQEDLRAEIYLLRNSLSWKVTRPLRSARASCRNFLIAHKEAQSAWLAVRPLIACALRLFVGKR